VKPNTGLGKKQEIFFLNKYKNGKQELSLPITESQKRAMTDDSFGNLHYSNS
jgi:hypothetical protein